MTLPCSVLRDFSAFCSLGEFNFRAARWSCGVGRRESDLLREPEALFLPSFGIWKVKDDPGRPLLTQGLYSAWGSVGGIQEALIPACQFQWPLTSPCASDSMRTESPELLASSSE